MTRKMEYQAPEVVEVFTLPLGQSILDGGSGDIGLKDYDEGGEMEEG